MYWAIVTIVILKLSAASEEPLSHKDIEKYNYNENHYKLNKRQNHSFIDKDENMLRVPTVNKIYFEDHKVKKKIKKTPKRTIQKIIKKNKGKLRKVYFSQVTKQPTIPPKHVEYDRMYGQEDFMKRETTTQFHKHRNKITKVSRYHMPFQKIHKMKDDRRYKRGLSREMLILKNLDQIQFLSKEKDNNLVVPHITNNLKV